jgi:uncharacterized protein
VDSLVEWHLEGEDQACLVPVSDSRLEKGVWTISRWWWEPDVIPAVELLDALRVAVAQFLCYLRADGVRAGEGVDEVVRRAIVSVG